MDERMPLTSPTKHETDWFICEVVISIIALIAEGGAIWYIRNERGFWYAQKLIVICMLTLLGNFIEIVTEYSALDT